MKSSQIFVFTILLTLSLAVTSLQAQPPQLLNYQGKLVMDGTPANGDFNITFAMYSSATGGTALWNETQNVTVTNGVFNVLLGSVTPFPSTLFTGSGDRYLGITVGSDQEMEDRFRLTSVAYALRAAESDGVADGAVTTVDLADNAVTSAKITNNAVTSSKIQDGQVRTNDLANNAVTSSKIQNNAVTYTKRTITTFQALDGSFKSHTGTGTTEISRFVFSSVPAGDVFVTLTCFAGVQPGKKEQGTILLLVDGSAVGQVPTHTLITTDLTQLTLYGSKQGFAGGTLVVSLTISGESSDSGFTFSVANDGRFGRRVTVIAGL